MHKKTVGRNIFFADGYILAVSGYFYITVVSPGVGIL